MPLIAADSGVRRLHRLTQIESTPNTPKADRARPLDQDWAGLDMPVPADLPV